MNEELKVIISAEISKLKQNVEKAKQSVSGFKEEVKKASADVDKQFAAMGGAIANGAKTAAVGLAATAGAVLALGASTAEYRAEQARLVSAFEAAGSTAEQAKETYNDLYRVLGDSGAATEAAQHLANITTEEKALGEYTTILQGVWAAYGSSLPLEGLAEAIGHSSALGEVQGSLADSLEWAGISTDSFNEKLAELNTQEEREKLIRDTLNGLYGESAAIYEENNAQVLAQNEANARLQETLAALGEAVAPIVTAFTAFGSEALAVVVPYIQSLADTYGPALNEALTKTGEVLGVVMGYLSDNWPILLAIAGVVAGIAAAIGLYNAVAAVKAAMDALQVTTLGALIKAYAAQAVAALVAIAPYLLIVAAIAAVIAIIVLCIKHWDKISAVVKKVWANIKDWTKQAVSVVVSKFNEMKDKAASIVNNIKSSFVNGWNSMVSSVKSILSNIVTAVKDKFNAVVNGIKEKMDKAKNTVKSIIDAIKGFFGFKISWPKIPMPKFSISPSGWKIGDLLKGSIPKLSISWNALGGVFDNPTILPYGGSLQGLGENGAEAIVPLEKNLKWLDKLATMLSDRMGGNAPIVLNVDGKVFAQTAVSAINQQTRQTGRLALNLV